MHMEREESEDNLYLYSRLLQAVQNKIYHTHASISISRQLQPSYWVKADLLYLEGHHLDALQQWMILHPG